jgi:transcription elongation factor GreA
MAQQSDRFILTRTGYEALQRELQELERRHKAHQAELHDVQLAIDPEAAEGAEYDARTGAELIDERLTHLRRVLEYAQIMDEDPDPHRVDPGERVTVWDFAENTTRHFDLIGSQEVIYGLEGVSIDSPVGQALLGRRVGDVIEVQVPDGIVRYAIRNIERL